jgi:hypothetical protein
MKNRKKASDRLKPAMSRKDYARGLNCISHLLNLIPYRQAPREKVRLPKRDTKGAYDDQATLKGRRFVPEKY